MRCFQYPEGWIGHASNGGIVDHQTSKLCRVPWDFLFVLSSTFDCRERGVVCPSSRVDPLYQEYSLLRGRVELDDPRLSWRYLGYEALLKLGFLGDGRWYGDVAMNDVGDA